MAKDIVDDGTAAIGEVIRASEPRPEPSESAETKIKYAVRFADVMAKRMAADLGDRLPGITATAGRTAGSIKGPTQLDVNYSTSQNGLGLGISLKSVHIPEMKKGKLGRYTHNVKRNLEESRIEAIGYHKRQPFAVMVSVLFLPFASCDDAKTGPSSFGSWARDLRPHCGRVRPEGDLDSFEKIYIALYEPDGSDLRFFDVESDPPKSGRPSREGVLYDETGRSRRLLTYAEFLHEIHHFYLRRNKADFSWADGEEEPLAINELEAPASDDESELD